MPKGGGLSVPITATLQTRNARVIPYSEMLHTQGSRSPLVIVRVTLGIEKFNDCRNRGYGHHDQMRESIPMDADEELAVKNVMSQQKKKRERDFGYEYPNETLTVVRAASASCSSFEMRSMATTLSSHPRL